MLGLNMRKSPTKYSLEMRRKVRKYTKLNKKAKEDQIVIAGDSIVELYDSKMYFNDYKREVYNRGISGDTSDRLLARLDDNVLSCKPHMVYILIGTNDVDRGISANKTMEYIIEIVKKLKANNVKKIVLISILPINDSLDNTMVGSRSNEYICALNERIKTVAKDAHVEYADVYSTLIDENGLLYSEYTEDGLHPSYFGYRKMTHVLRTFLD